MLKLHEFFAWVLVAWGLAYIGYHGSKDLDAEAWWRACAWMIGPAMCMGLWVTLLIRGVR